MAVRDFKNRRDEWLEARKNYITASEAAAFMGKNPYKSRKRAIADKVHDAGFTPGVRAIAGTHLEDGIARIWRDVEGVRVRACDSFFASTKYPWLAATPDLFVLVPFAGFGVADLKYSEKIDRDGTVPEYYRIQVEQQLAVLGLERGWIVSFWGIHFTKAYYEYDQKRIDVLVEATRDAWEEIQKERAKL